MDMWISWAMRRRSCVTCTKPIMPGDKVMVGQWKRTGIYAGVKGTRTNRTASHWECYKSKAEVWWDDNPYTPVIQAGPGRPIKYTPEQKKRRASLHAMIDQNRKKQIAYIGDDMWATADRYADKIRVYRDELNGMLT